MVCDRYALVDRQPIPDDVHTVLKESLKVREAGNGDADVDTNADERPDEPGYTLGTAGQDLKAQGERVEIWAVTGDSRESEDD